MKWRDLRCGEVLPEHVGQRLDPQRIVVVEGDRATIRARGERDVEVPLSELVVRLSGS